MNDLLLPPPGTPISVRVEGGGDKLFLEDTQLVIVDESGKKSMRRVISYDSITEIKNHSFGLRIKEWSGSEISIAFPPEGSRYADGLLLFLRNKSLYPECRICNGQIDMQTQICTECGQPFRKSVRWKGVLQVLVGIIGMSLGLLLMFIKVNEFICNSMMIISGFFLFFGIVNLCGGTRG